MKIELLSPVGTKESLIAAIMGGCDAVYLGGTLFGARAFAGNFNNDELVEAISFAHLYGVKVYVTANILIFENEVDRFMEYIDFLHHNNVDAIIMQDLGMVDLVHQTYPNLEIHASTQMHIHNLDGVLFCEKMGLKRVVLARETSIDQINNIKKNSHIDLEIFVHGALCVSYSGQCLFSSLIGKRSGNRGSCVGSCRLPYKIIDESGKKLNNGDYPLSMKDLNSLEHLGELIDAGARSLKIEGRMKSPEYVYTVTRLYRLAIDSYYKNHQVYIDEKELNNLKKIFNRQFTKGFLFNEDSLNIFNDYRPNHQGIVIGKVIKSDNNVISIKLNHDVHINDGLRIVDDEDYGFNLNQFYINGQLVKEARAGNVITTKLNKNFSISSEVLLTKDITLQNNIDTIIGFSPRKINLNGKVVCQEKKPLSIMFTDGKNTVNVTGNLVTHAINNPVTKEVIINKLNKLGNTIYCLDSIEVYIDDEVFISLKELNDLRHQAIEELNNQRLYSTNYLKSTYKRVVSNFEIEHLKSILVHEYNNNCNKYDIIYSELLNGNTILKIPKIMSDYSGYDSNKCYLVGEIGALNYFKNFICDYSFNVTNSYTIALLHSLGALRVMVSYELTNKQISNMIVAYKERYQSNPNLEALVYGYREVMSLKLDLARIYKNENIYLVDRFNNKYKIRKYHDINYIYDYHLLRENIDDYYDIGVAVGRYNEEI